MNKPLKQHEGCGGRDMWRNINRPFVELLSNEIYKELIVQVWNPLVDLLDQQFIKQTKDELMDNFNTFV
jgi:hypothetical protein